MQNHQNPNQENFLKVSEVAELLNINYWTAIQYIKKGLLKGFKLNTQWRVPASEVVAFIEKSYRPPMNAQFQEV